MYCEECETIQELIYDETTFWMTAPTGEAFEKFKGAFSQTYSDCTFLEGRLVSVKVAEDQVSDFLSLLRCTLEPPELAACNILTSRGEKPGLKDLGRIMKADHFINRFECGWIIRSIDKKRFETWFQPIVHAKNPALTFAHEGLFRMRNDEDQIVSPALVFQLAQSTDLLFSLDLAARRSAAEHAAKANLKSKIFINFNPTSIYDPTYCLRETAAAIKNLGFQPEDIVFEITETHRMDDIDHLRKILSFYREAGFGVALDDIGSGWSSLNLLHHVTPDYIKLDMELCRNVTQSEMKQAIVRNLIAMGLENNIKTICEGIETREEADWLKDAGADYLQGYFFGKPTFMAPCEIGEVAQ